MGVLFKRSIEIILDNQNPSGAFPACPTFPTYRYCWFRDGSYTAYAMDLIGEHESAARFHSWAANIVIKYADIVSRAVSKAERGETLAEEDVLHTRYTVDGEPATEDWPNFQLDGLGTWLWSLGEHVRLSRSTMPAEWIRASALAAEYLAALWRRPCYDCWEEHPEEIHPYTLAAVYAGLLSQAKSRAGKRAPSAEAASAIRAFILEHCVANGHVVKFVGSSDVDASLLGLSAPYAVVRPDHPYMRNTVANIESVLRKGGGVHRYATDSYYGGGEWLLLTAWLGWYWAQIGDAKRVAGVLKWIEAQADEDGHLAEQLPRTLIKPEFYEPWRKRWGEIASPLLWSHAKYIILYQLTS